MLVGNKTTHDMKNTTAGVKQRSDCYLSERVSEEILDLGGRFPFLLHAESEAADTSFS